MPKSLITELQKESIRLIIDDVHETFAREINVFGKGCKVNISSSPTYNSIYGRKSSGERGLEVEPIKNTIKARIRYIDASSDFVTSSDVQSELNIKIPDGSVRLTVDQAGFTILKDASRCEFEGRKYEIISKGNPTGMFGPQYFEFFLMPTDE